VTGPLPHHVPSPNPTARTAWFRRLSPGQKVAAGVLALVIPCCGGLTAIGALAGDPQQTDATKTRTVARASSMTGRPTAAAQSSTPASPASTTSPPAKIEKRQVVETQEVPFQSTTVNDATMPAGTQKTRTRGVPGLKTLTYEITLTDGAQTDKRLVSETVTRAAVTEVVVVGTKESTCDPNYSGACVPIASDVDCAGGSGNGPAYVRGPVQVIGTDIYDLDRDGDGIGCE
jgi:resuscitation-promoting factor RpfB